MYISDKDILEKCSKNLVSKMSTKDFIIIRKILDRFFNSHKIYFLSYVEEIISVGFNLGEGFKFIYKKSFFSPTGNFNTLSEILMSSGRFVDDSDSFIGKCASIVTNGKGFREALYGMNDGSLHCAINGDNSDVHLDETSFTFNFNGKNVYTINAPQHIAQDLVNLTFISPFLSSQLSKMPFLHLFGKDNIRYYFTDRMRLVVPNTVDGLDKYGADFNFYKTSMQRISLDYRRDMTNNLNNLLSVNSWNSLYNGVNGFDGGNSTLMLWYRRSFR